MADEKISQLDAVTDVLDDDDYVLARAGASKRITGASLKADLGGSSSLPETISGPGALTIEGTDNTVPAIVNVDAPADFVDNSPNGDFIACHDSDANRVVSLSAEGDMTLGAPGWGQAIIQLHNPDAPTYHLLLEAGNASDDYIAAYGIGGAVFRVKDGGLFQVRASVDDIVFNVQAVDDATAITFYVNAAPGQTGHLLEIDTLPDGNPCLLVGPNGEIDMPMLPTADPLVAGRLWNSSGTLKVSAG